MLHSDVFSLHITEENSCNMLPVISLWGPVLTLTL